MNATSLHFTLSTRRAFLCRVAIASLAGVSVRGGAAPASPVKPSPEPEGADLAAALRRQPPSLNTSGTLRRRDQRGTWLPPLPVALEVRGDDAAWDSLYRVFASSGALMETLIVSHSLTEPNRYTYQRAPVGSEPTPRLTLQGNEAVIPLAGSEFWLCDLGMEFLHWPAQRILRTEMRKGRSCRVLESRNPDPQPGAYARVLSWIDLESGGLLRAEAFDGEGKRMKEFNIGSLKKIEGRYQLKSMEIRDERTDARSRLEFDLEIEE